MDDLFKVAVGVLGHSPATFFSCEPREVELAIEGYNANQKINFYHTQVAMTNAVGAFFGGKKFKPMDPFTKERKRVETSTMEEKEATFAYLRDTFKI